MPMQGKHLFWLFVPVAIVVIGDLLTKQLALNYLFFPPRSLEVLPFLNLVPVWNPGISFGMLQNQGEWMPFILGGFAFAVGVGLPVYARDWERLPRFGAQAMAGGAFGNALDRVFYGKVVDFIDLYAGQWHWPAFNVADMAITCGAGIIVLASVRESRQNRSSEAKGKTDSDKASDEASEGDGKG